MTHNSPTPDMPRVGTPALAPPRKSLSTGGIIAIVVGSLLALCCVLGTVAVLASSDDTGKSTSVAATDNPPTSPGPATSDAAPSLAPNVEPKGPATVKVGQAINVKFLNDETRVTVKSIKKAMSPNQFTQPKRGQFVAVMVDIFAAKGDTDLGPSNFRLIAKDGTVYKAEFLVVGIDPQLDAMTTVNEGQRKNDNIVFDVDPDKVAGSS
ncbi:hypothetical protein Cme02nite_55710 [Catellatospora methionotrophica]|uniref:DUF4352 domain-containing protein n=1 Tax=Catellatospora methionotrophica TaxID=121620 RepID=A0A8J3PI08_9ACTN|nr:DUF4352 domain-containing protein [Catellatospora methionotrophica]GIG17239.1 hypothetical protein Cme02nite_55710 [Catellatospora methionotrophica]